jgi:hypothetical protein
MLSFELRYLLFNRLHIKNNEPAQLFANHLFIVAATPPDYCG